MSPAVLLTLDSCERHRHARSQPVGVDARRVKYQRQVSEGAALIC